MQTCTICRSEKRNEIDEALLRGEPLRTLAKRTAVGSASLLRHKKAHIPATLAKAKGAAELVQAGVLMAQVSAQESGDAARADTLLDRLRALNQETAAILRAAREAEDNELALKAIARVEKQIELEGKILGQLGEATRVSLMIGTHHTAQDTFQEQVVQLAELYTVEELQDMHARAEARLAGRTPDASAIIQG
jgi:hypothetical protein